jgi:hypothetical protein
MMGMTRTKDDDDKDKQKKHKTEGILTLVSNRGTRCTTGHDPDTQYTGGENTFTHQAHVEFIVSSEKIRSHFTHWAHVEDF